PRGRRRVSQQSAPAVPGRPPPGAGRPAQSPRNYRPRRGLPGRPGRRLLEGPRGTPGRLAARPRLHPQAERRCRHPSPPPLGRSPQPRPRLGNEILKSRSERRRPRLRKSGGKEENTETRPSPLLIALAFESALERDGVLNSYFGVLLAATWKSKYRQFRSAGIL